jgi:hypothetical protein
MPTSQHKDRRLNIVLDGTLYDAFFAATKTEAAVHGFEYAGGAQVLRQLMREYVARVESTAQSTVARAAAKVLSKRVRT